MDEEHQYKPDSLINDIMEPEEQEQIQDDEFEVIENKVLKPSEEEQVQKLQQKEDSISEQQIGNQISKQIQQTIQQIVPPVVHQEVKQRIPVSIFAKLPTITPIIPEPVFNMDQNNLPAQIAQSEQVYQYPIIKNDESFQYSDSEADASWASSESFRAMKSKLLGGVSTDKVEQIIPKAAATIPVDQVMEQNEEDEQNQSIDDDRDIVGRFVEEMTQVESIAEHTKAISVLPTQASTLEKSIKEIQLGLEVQKDPSKIIDAKKAMSKLLQGAVEKTSNRYSEYVKNLEKLAKRKPDLEFRILGELNKLRSDLIKGFQKATDVRYDENLAVYTKSVQTALQNFRELEKKDLPVISKKMLELADSTYKEVNESVFSRYANTLLNVADQRLS